MFDNIIKLFKKPTKKETLNPNSKEAAKERLHLVLMQDRVNVSADFLDIMREEIIGVIKKYIDIDENSMDVRLTNQANDDGTQGAPALYANIPILNIKNETISNIEKNKPEVKEKTVSVQTKKDNSLENDKEKNEEEEQENKENIKEDNLEVEDENKEIEENDKEIEEGKELEEDSKELEFEDKKIEEDGKEIKNEDEDKDKDKEIEENGKEIKENNEETEEDNKKVKKESNNKGKKKSPKNNKKEDTEKSKDNK